MPRYCGLITFNKFEETLTGVPQGGIASPILFNIYMHEFDKYINGEFRDLINQYNIDSKRINPQKKTTKTNYRNPLYHKIGGKIDYCRKIIREIMTKDNYSNLDNKNKEKLAQQHKILKKYTKERIKIPSIDKSKRPISFTYVRYADDYVLYHTLKCKKTTCRNFKKRNW
jgi:retron-type reverse transcriptase